MTTNAFIFCWDCYGIESIIPISEYEHHDKQQLINMLSDNPVKVNPLNAIIGSLQMRARANHHRHYEIYSVDCEESLTREFWRQQWETYPQETAELIRKNGVKLYSDRGYITDIKIL